MDLIDHAHLDRRDQAALRQTFEPLHTLGDLLEWARCQTPPLPAPVVVTQDEYTHDVLLAFVAGRWLDFDTT